MFCFRREIHKEKNASFFLVVPFTMVNWRRKVWQSWLCFYLNGTSPTNIGTARATPVSTPLVVISDGGQIWVVLGCSEGSLFCDIQTPDLALGQLVTKCKLAILVGLLSSTVQMKSGGGEEKKEFNLTGKTVSVFLVLHYDDGVSGGQKLTFYLLKKANFVNYLEKCLNLSSLAIESFSSEEGLKNLKKTRFESAWVLSLSLFYRGERIFFVCYAQFGDERISKK